MEDNDIKLHWTQQGVFRQKYVELNNTYRVKKYLLI